MRLLDLPKRVFRKLQVPIFKALGRDNITYSRVWKRTDLSEVGTRYGGWMIPTNMIDSESIVYCVGCGEDISFDLGVLEKFDCHIHAFDPTPRAISYVKEHAGSIEKYHFYDLGLWDKEETLKFYAPRNPEHVSHSALNLQQTSDYIEAKVKRLSSIMKDNHHESLDLLKIDIEGSEYKVLRSIIDDEINVGVLCVEYDERANPLDNSYKDRIKESVKEVLEYGFQMVHFDGYGNFTFVNMSSH